MSKKKNDDKLFRYLLKYVGTYRILAHYDEDEGDFPRDEEGNIDESFDELYVKCSKGEVRCSYKTVQDKGVIFCWYTESGEQCRNVYKQLKAEYPKMWMELDDCDTYDGYIYFEESDLPKVMKAVGNPKSGASIPPYSDKNLPKPDYEIPEKDEAKYNKLIEKLDKAEKMQFARRCASDFDAVLIEKFSTKKKVYDPTEERKKLRMKPKMFAHYKGMWNEYLDFVKKELKEYEEL